MPMRPDYWERPYVPAKDPLAAIPPSRHPFQVWVMFACALGGLGNLITPGSDAARELLHPVFVEIWAVTLLFGGLTALISLFWRDRVMGMLIERLALTAIGISCPTYALILGMAAGLSAVVGATLTASVGIAALWRVFHINRELRMLRDFMRRTGIVE